MAQIMAVRSAIFFLSFHHSTKWSHRVMMFGRNSIRASQFIR